MEKSVLLMFLGGVPNSPNIIRHWVNMNTRFDNKDNVYVVVHPISLPYVINEEFSSIFKKENVYVVDESHHVATMWGTLSLVDAELLMMQYGHKMRGDKLYYDKYILLSNTCCPLYTMDVIYSDVLSDDKSIIGAFPYPNPKNQSQWMVLDKQHARIFFTVSSTDTYEKDSLVASCQTIKDEKKLNRLRINMPVNPTLYNLEYAKFYNEKKICQPADELFFIEYMMDHFRMDDITDHLRTLKPAQVVRNIKSVPLDVYYALKRITDLNKEEITHLEPIILGNVPYHIQKSYMDTRIFTSNDTLFVFSTSVLGCTFSTEYNPSNVLRDFSAFDDFNVNDFIHMNASPRELLSYVSTKITDCDTLRTRLDIKENSDVFSIVPRRPILTTISHPIEYSTYTLRSIMNTFILLYKISCLFHNTFLYGGWNNTYVNAMRVIMIVYLTIISKEFGMCDQFKKRVVLNYKIILQNRFTELMDTMDEFLTLLHKKYLDMPVDTLERLLNKKYGTLITNDSLLSAICNQSYFIRKCYDSSHIETFSDVLKTLPMITSLPEPRDEFTLSLVTPQRVRLMPMHFSYACPRERKSLKKKKKNTKKSRK